MRRSIVVTTLVALSGCPTDAPSSSAPLARDCTAATPKIIQRFSSSGSMTDAKLGEEGIWVTTAPLQGRRGSLQLIGRTKGETIRNITVGYVPLAIGLSQGEVWIAHASRFLVDAPPLLEPDASASFPAENSVLRIDRRSGRILDFAAVNNPVSVATTTKMVWVLESSARSPGLLGFTTGNTSVPRRLSPPAGFGVISAAGGESVWGVSGVGMPRASLWRLGTAGSSVDVKIPNLDQSKVLGLKSRPLSVQSDFLWVVKGNGVARMRLDSDTFDSETPVPFVTRAIGPARGGSAWVVGREGEVAFICNDGSMSLTLHVKEEIDVMTSDGRDAWLGTATALIHVRW